MTLTSLPLLPFLMVFTALFAGVVLPAVWSRKAVRREAALRVLSRLLGAVRPGGRGR
ncbi:hypothetical protein ABZ782_18815 [Streptomyces asoensis]|uniref:hypothetical protein n=1 Tax=Streptomyces asoensis TaxID=249586 RepID=UPI0033E41388